MTPPAFSLDLPSSPDGTGSYGDLTFGIVKSLHGVLCDGRPDLSNLWALIFTQEYPGARWFSNEPYSRDNDMSLPGATVDGSNAEAWTRRLVKGIQSLRARNASKDEVFARVETKARGAEGCCWYFQGHGIYIPGRVNRYLTAQNSVNEGENWDGLDPKDMRKLLRLTNHLAWRIIATDFCHSGNCFALQFVLYIEGDTAEWREAAGWLGGEPCAPTIHFAGSKENESVYEGSQTGGFFTETLTKPREMLAIPDLLRALRLEVNISLDAAKRKGAIEIDKTQTPQIFSSVKLSLEDTHALIKFQQSRSA